MFRIMHRLTLTHTQTGLRGLQYFEVRKEGFIMHDFHTPAILFIVIVGGYVAFSLFALGANKVYFEPFSDPKEDEKA